jgi:hypothetical protein
MLKNYFIKNIKLINFYQRKIFKNRVALYRVIYPKNTFNDMSTGSEDGGSDMDLDSEEEGNRREMEDREYEQDEEGGDREPMLNSDDDFANNGSEDKFDFEEMDELAEKEEEVEEEEADVFEEIEYLEDNLQERLEVENTEDVQKKIKELEQEDFDSKLKKGDHYPSPYIYKLKTPLEDHIFDHIDGFKYMNGKFC